MPTAFAVVAVESDLANDRTHALSMNVYSSRGLAGYASIREPAFAEGKNGNRGIRLRVVAKYAFEVSNRPDGTNGSVLLCGA